MTKGVPFVQITMLFMQTTFKYCAKYTIIHLLEEKEISIMYIQGGICMISFLVCLALLIGGYFVYGNLVNNIFNPDDRETPAVRINDGVDYVVMPDLRSHAGCILGTGRIPVDHLRYDLCRRCS